MHIIISAVSSNTAHGVMYSMQHYVSHKVSQLLVAGRWFSPGTLVSSNNTTDRHDIAERLLTLKPPQYIFKTYPSAFPLDTLVYAFPIDCTVVVGAFVVLKM